MSHYCSSRLWSPEDRNSKFFLHHIFIKEIAVSERQTLLSGEKNNRIPEVFQTFPESGESTAMG